MKRFTLLFMCYFLAVGIKAQSNRVEVKNKERGTMLSVDGKPLMINGVNWDYVPIGQNYSYSLWNQSDDIIKRALDSEMSMLKNMGVNTIRVYTGIPKQWISYIYNQYGIYTMLNHSFGRYGLTLNGTWFPNTDYSDARVIDLLIKETTQLAKDYQNTPGLLLYLLGNENNYGLFLGRSRNRKYSDGRS